MCQDHWFSYLLTGAVSVVIVAITLAFVLAVFGIAREIWRG